MIWTRNKNRRRRVGQIHYGTKGSEEDVGWKILQRTWEKCIGKCKESCIDWRHQKTKVDIMEKMNEARVPNSFQKKLGIATNKFVKNCVCAWWTSHSLKPIVRCFVKLSNFLTSHYSWTSFPQSPNSLPGSPENPPSYVWQLRVQEKKRYVWNQTHDARYLDLRLSFTF